MADFTQQFEEICHKTINEQTKYFLRQFVTDFQGKFEVVLDIAEEFRNYAPEDQRETTGSIEEFKAHLFLEKRKETLTVKDLRDYLKQVKLAAHHPVAIVEYLLWKYQKSVPQLFEARPAGSVPAHILQALDDAIAAYLAAKREDEERVKEMKKMEELAKGKRSVASVQAHNKKEELAGQEFAAAFKKMQALKKKKEAEEALANAPKTDPYEEEQKRLAAEKLRKEEEERKRKEESRARLKAKAALWS